MARIDEKDTEAEERIQILKLDNKKKETEIL